MNEEFERIFERIRDMFRKHEAQCVLQGDEPGRYYLDTREVRAKDGYRTMFGGVEIKKNYVSAHLMPVYVHADMLGGISGELKRRMQGKSCFNFRKLAEPEMTQLEALVDAGAKRFTDEGRM